MSQLIAVVTNDKALKPAALHGLREEVQIGLGESTGVGLGWIQGGRSLLRINPRPAAASPSLLGLLGDVPTRAIVGWTRAAGLPQADSIDMQPFRFRKWIYASSGEVPEMKEIREEFLNDVPEFIQANIKGSLGAEVLFHHLLGCLQREDSLEVPGAKVGHVAELIASATARMECEGAITNHQAVIATERAVFGVRLGDPLSYRVIKGIKVVGDKLFAGHRPSSTNHPSFRAAIIVSGSPPTDEWTEVPDRNLIWFDADWQPQLRAIEP